MPASAARRLIRAIKSGSQDAAAAAIADGPDYEELVDQVTPLHWAIHSHQFEIARMILEAGGSPEVRDGMDSTPLMYCAKARTDQLVDEEAVRYARLLLEHGAEVTPRCQSGHLHLPLTIARLRGKSLLAELLEQHGARTIDTRVRIEDADGQPLATQFAYGPPWAMSFAAGESDPAGELLLEAVIEGPLLIRRRSDETSSQQIVINGDGTVTPSSLVWPDR